MRPQTRTFATIASLALAASVSAGWTGGRAAARGSADIQAGETVSGALEASDEQMQDGTRFDRWVYAAVAGERITVTMKSEAFDAYVSIVHPGAEHDVVLARNDDGAGGTNARASVQIRTAGPVHILANTMVQDALGPYTLRVESDRKAK